MELELEKKIIDRAVASASARLRGTETKHNHEMIGSFSTYIARALSLSLSFTLSLGVMNIE